MPVGDLAEVGVVGPRLYRDLLRDIFAVRIEKGLCIHADRDNSKTLLLSQ